MNRVLFVATLLMVATLLAALVTQPPQAQAKKPMMGASLSGKALVAANHCNSCHNPDLKGKAGFSPGITSTGELKGYTKAQFETMLASGKTPHGGMVMRPMPVFKMSASKADAIYAYLKTLK